MGSAPIIDMSLMNAKGMSPSDAMAIITTNTSSQTVVQLYVKINNVFDELYFSPIQELTSPTTGTIVNVTWSNLATLITSSGSLPAGTQQTAQYPQVINNGTTANRPTTGTYAGMPFFDTTLNKPIWRNSSNNGWVDSTGTTV
jgi:paraquat-inducible protein B